MRRDREDAKEKSKERDADSEIGLPASSVYHHLEAMHQQEQQQQEQQQQQLQRRPSAGSVGSVLSHALSQVLSRASSLSGASIGSFVPEEEEEAATEPGVRCQKQVSTHLSGRLGQQEEEGEEEDELQMEREPQQQQQEQEEQEQRQQDPSTSSSYCRLGPRQSSTTSTGSARSSSFWPRRQQRQHGPGGAGHKRHQQQRQQSSRSPARTRQRLLSREEAEEGRREREARSIAIEKAYVHDVYEQISLHISDSRYRSSSSSSSNNNSEKLKIWKQTKKKMFSQVSSMAAGKAVPAGAGARLSRL